MGEPLPQPSPSPASCRRKNCALAESHFFFHPSEPGPDGDEEGVPSAMLEATASAPRGAD